MARKQQRFKDKCHEGASAAGIAYNQSYEVDEDVPSGGSIHITAEDAWKIQTLRSKRLSACLQRRARGVVL